MHDGHQVPETTGAPVEGAVRRAVERRPNGLLVMALVVFVGLGAGAGLYRWQQSRSNVAVAKRLAAAPTDPEGRLRAWREYGAPTIHQRLVTSRISFQQPWLVTHAIDSSVPGEPPEIWGIDLDAVGQDATTVEGRFAIVRLPAPRLLLRTVLVGNNARGVRHYRPDETPPDASEAVRSKVEWMLATLAAALERDIEGARLVILVGDEELSERL
jgi:hypothetical protein